MQYCNLNVFNLATVELHVAQTNSLTNYDREPSHYDQCNRFNYSQSNVKIHSEIYLILNICKSKLNDIRNHVRCHGP